MLSTDQSHLRKYLATLGVATIAGVISLSGLILRLQDDLLVTASELEALTPSAQRTLEQRQQYLGLGTTALPWFLTFGCLVGLGLCVYGLVGWSRRQVVTDELEDIARDRGKTELRRLTDAERVDRLEREVEPSPPLPDGAAVPQATAKSELSTPGEPSGRPRSQKDSAQAFQRAIETELQLAIAVEELLGSNYLIELGVEARKGNLRQQFDLVATSTEGRRQYVFELKYLRSFGKNYRSALSHGITTAAAGASLLGESVVPIVVLVFEDDPGQEVMNRARAYAQQLAGSFRTPPRVVFMSSDDIGGANLSPLRRALDL